MTEWADPAQWGVMYDDNTVCPRTEWWAKRFVGEGGGRKLMRRTVTGGWEPWVEPEVESCPTCGSDDPKVRLGVPELGRGVDGEFSCNNSWHTTPEPEPIPEGLEGRTYFYRDGLGKWARTDDPDWYVKHHIPVLVATLSNVRWYEGDEGIDCAGSDLIQGSYEFEVPARPEWGGCGDDLVFHIGEPSDD